MNYCQDCGGANPASATTCRICGLQLIRERNGPPCQSCGSPTVVDANFCSRCGATTVAAAMASAASVLPGSLKVDAAIAEERQTSAARLNATLNLGEGLELPDWLKRAAAEQPFDPSRQTAITANPFGLPTGTTATVAAASPVPAGNGTPTGDAIPMAEPHRPPGGDDVVATAPAAAAAPVRDVADTSSFISEEDLPEWIRQIAAADAAKKAEEERRAAEAATEQGKVAGAADSRRRQPLPGEATATAPAASPWLARRERAEAPETVAADSWGAAAPAATAGAARGESEPVTDPASTPEPVVAEQLVAPADAPAAKQPNQLRLVLVAAVVLMVVALIAFMALS